MPTASKSTAVQIVGSQEGMKSLTAALQGGLDDILPGKLSASRLIKIACIATTKEPKLLQCTKSSMILALTASAELALDPSGTLGHSWIIPFFDHKRKVMEAVFIPGWKGLVQLAYRSGRVESIMPAAVYEQDRFAYQLGDKPRLDHTPAQPTPERKCWIATRNEDDKKGTLAGALVGAYCTWTVSGVRSFKFMWAEELEKIRLSSKAPCSPAYRDWTEAMMVKGVVRASVALMPLSVEDQQSIAIATQSEDAAMGLKPFIDVTSEVIEDGAHPIGASTPGPTSDPTPEETPEEGTDG